MALERSNCPHCGAPLGAIMGGIETCASCGRPARVSLATQPPPQDLAQALIARPSVPPMGARGARPREGGPGSRFRHRLAGGTSGPPRVRVAIARGQAPITLPPGKVGGVFRRRAFEKDVDKLHSFGWTDDEIVDLARKTLGSNSDLHYAPEIPAAKLAVARGVHGDALGDERVLVFFDDPLFGGGDDGFVVTPRALLWKNLADDPQCLGWDEIDPSAVTYDDDEHRIGLHDAELRLTHADAEALAPRLHDLIVVLASLAQDEDQEMP